MAMPGDVFTTRQPKGQYGAVRIIRKRGKEYLAYCSTYLGRKPPSLDDPALREWVIQRRFEYAAKPALCWIGDEPPRHLRLIGNLAPDAAEKRRKCETYGTGWSAVTDDVYYEWRWRNDRKDYHRRHRLPKKDRQGVQLSDRVQSGNRFQCEGVEGAAKEDTRLMHFSNPASEARALTP